MPRPARGLWVTRTYARRRHRSWMMSMSLASLGWGTWWVVLFLHHLAPHGQPPWGVVTALSIGFAVPGLGLALLSLRATRSWLLFVVIPLLANAALLALPWIAIELWAHPS